MATRIATKFDQYEFDDNEYALAVIFSDLNLMHIKTELGIAMERKMNIIMDPDATDPHDKFIKEHEFSRGYVASLQYLIELHETTQTELMRRLKEASAVEQQFQSQFNQSGTSEDFGL